MRVYGLKEGVEGPVTAFEIDNLRFTRRSIIKQVGQVEGVKILKTPKLFSWLREEVFCEFEFAGHVYIIWEPFGDNSRYWIGPKQPGNCPSIEPIKAMFEGL